MVESFFCPLFAGIMESRWRGSDAGGICLAENHAVTLRYIEKNRTFAMYKA